MPTRVDFLATTANVKITKDGVTASHQYMVYDLGGDKETRIARAVTMEGIPVYRQPHPGIASIFAEEIDGQLVAGDIDSVIVTVNYKSPDKNKGGAADDKWTIQTGAVVQTIQTNYLAEYLDPAKKTRKPFPSVKYVWQDADGLGPDQRKRAGTQTTGTGLVEINVPVLSWRMTRREESSPKAKSLAYTGKVNNTAWNDSPPRTWLCTRLDGQSDDQGKTYVVNYEFLYREETWDADVVFIDPETGKPPPGVGTGQNNNGKDNENGILRAQPVYFAADFKELNLEGEPPKPAIGFTGP